MVVGAVLDDNGRPVCCEMWPGNTTDVKTMIPVVDRLRHRFGIGQFCIVADRGMISSDTISKLEARQLPYILGTRMRRVKEVKAEILTRAGRYKEVYPENADRSKPSPLKVKEVIHNDTRYIICLNERQARKDAADRQTIIESLKKQLKKVDSVLPSEASVRGYAVKFFNR
ncbi:transposase [uncultured Desulfobacter sp.]|uniref:IS1634 family transposase n=1 Tax=uncultured Desulfobacter sp. TaxID=240139 RepID=UPI0029F4C000|nr:transposase [uncultured Desulfobacter sp.]